MKAIIVKVYANIFGYTNVFGDILWRRDSRIIVEISKRANLERYRPEQNFVNMIFYALVLDIAFLKSFNFSIIRSKGLCC